MFKQSFADYLQETNVTGSGKASSYILAIDWLNKMLVTEPFGFNDCNNIWAVSSVERLHELYLFVLEEAKKKNESAWNIQGIPKSYLQNGYCSAALKSYQLFLVTYSYEQNLLNALDVTGKDESEIIEGLDTALTYPDFLIDDMDKKIGKDIVRAVRVRSNQNVFRKMILKIYKQTCCVTGLNIPEINRASHIIAWAEDEKKRLDPRNGLCLSATYDAAFDKNLISLDDDYRLIVSKYITDHFTNNSVKEYFINKQGKCITLPLSYLPHKDYLRDHRSHGEF